MMTKRLAATTFVLFAIVAGSADARAVDSDVIIAPTGACMISDLGGGIACFGEAVPSTYTDGYLGLRRSGKTYLGEAGGMLTGSPDAWDTPRVHRGDRWNRRGVRCRVIPGGIKCFNGRHGFRLKKHGYRTF